MVGIISEPNQDRQPYSICKQQEKHWCRSDTCNNSSKINSSVTTNNTQSRKSAVDKPITDIERSSSNHAVPSIQSHDSRQSIDYRK